MVLKADQQRVKALLSETITLLCKNGLNFRKEFSIEGLIGITLDQEEIFLVSIKETICSALAEAAVDHEQTKSTSVATAPSQPMNSSVARRRREREAEVKKNSSPPPSVVDVEVSNSQTESQSRVVHGNAQRVATPASTTNRESTSVVVVTTKQERHEEVDDDDATDVEDSVTANVNLTFSDIPDGGVDDGTGDVPAHKRRRIHPRQSGTPGQNSHEGVSASAGSAATASIDATSSGSGYEHSRDATNARGARESGGVWRSAKLEQSDVIEIKDELLSDGDEGEGDGEGGEEGGYNDYGSYEGMYGGGEQSQQGGMDMGMYSGMDAVGVGGEGSQGTSRRHSLPQGNGGGGSSSGSRQDPEKGDSESCKVETDFTVKSCTPHPVPRASPLDVSLDHTDHWPDNTMTRRRCKMPSCKGTSRVRCVKCHIHLCLHGRKNCFLTYHTRHTV